MCSCYLLGDKEGRSKSVDFREFLFYLNDCPHLRVISRHNSDLEQMSFPFERNCFIFKVHTGECRLLLLQVKIAQS